MTNPNTKKLLIFVGLLALGVLMRLIPHPANLTPVLAISLFAGSYFNNRYAFLLPIMIMLSSDFVVGFYSLPIMTVVYMSLLIPVLFGNLMSERSRWTVATFAIGGSVFFFLTTNFAVWAFTAMYSHTIWGLIDSYVMALPFLRTELLGTLLYSLAFFEMSAISSCSSTQEARRVWANAVQ